MSTYSEKIKLLRQVLSTQQSRIKIAPIYWYALSLFIKEEFLEEWVKEFVIFDKPHAHHFQRLTHLTPSDIVLSHWGNRSGKSVCACTEVSMECNGIHPLQPCSLDNLRLFFRDEEIEALDEKGWLEIPENQYRPFPVDWWAASPNLPLDVEVTLGKDSPILEKFYEWNIMPGQDEDPLLYKRGVKVFHRKAKILEYYNGSTVTFKSYNQETDKFASQAIDGIVFDEPPPRQIWTEAWTRLLDRKGKAFFAMTPDARDWTWDEFIINAPRYEGIKISEFKMSMFQNPFIPDDEKAKRMKVYESHGPEEVRRRVYGEYVDTSGLALKQFKREHFPSGNIVTYDDFPKIDDRDFSIYVIIDYHAAKPVYISYIAIDLKDIWYVYDESIIEDHVIYKIVQDIEGKTTNYEGVNLRVRKYIIDQNAQIPVTQEDGKQKTVVDMLRKQGIRCQIGNYRNFDAAHSLLEEKFLHKELLIHENCSEHIRQISTWGADRYSSGQHRGTLRDRFSDKDNDFCINLIYLANASPKFIGKKTAKEYPLTSYGDHVTFGNVR